MNPLALGLGLFVMVIWGLNFAVGKIALAELPPIFFMAVRFALVALALVWFAPVPRAHLRGLFFASIFIGAGHYALFFTGLTGVEAGASSIALQLQVPFAALVAAFVFRERLGWLPAAGMAVAFVGVVVIAGTPRIGANPIPFLLCVASGFVWALGNIRVKQLGRLNSFAVNAWIAVFTAPQLFFLSFLFESGQFDALSNAGWRGWGGILYMTVAVSIVSYSIWYWLIARFEVNQTMPLTLLMPAFGVASGAVFLDEALTTRLILGGLLTVAGVAVIQLYGLGAAGRAARAGKKGGKSV
ncbi:MAG: EamA family transporter [Proteobacteria bacterium]|nr:EamA family transporter [Pseudomonadota bacterium]